MAASPFKLAMITNISSPNSISVCLHIPQGESGSGVSPTIAMASNSLSPKDSALEIAALSAQISAPEEAFSMFPVEYILPLFPRSAAPTLKCE